MVPTAFFVARVVSCTGGIIMPELTIYSDLPARRQWELCGCRREEVNLCVPRRHFPVLSDDSTVPHCPAAEFFGYFQEEFELVNLICNIKLTLLIGFLA